MIRKTDIVAIMAVGLMAGGCTQTDDVQPGKGVPIRLAATVDGDRAIGSRTATRSGSTTSTTQDTELLEGQTVDAYIQEKGGDWLAQPVACTVDGDEGALTYSGDIYYPMDATPVEIYAVHPSYASAATFTVSSDQTDADNYAASDLCYSKTAEYGRSESAQTLVFSHVLSKIVVNVDMSALGGSHTVSNLRLKAKTQTTMTYPADNTNGYTLGTAATPASIAMNEGGAVVIPPQTTAAEGDVRISFDVSGIGPIVYEFPASTEFASNTQYTYTVKVGNTVTVTSTITAWDSQVNRSKTVEIGRPKLPIEYCAEYNMMSATELAPDNHVSNLAYFYWGSTTSAMSSTMVGFKNGITISGEKYHLPSMKEWVGVVGNTSWGEDPYIGYGNGTFLDRAEDVAWGVTNSSGTYSYEVNQAFYSDYDYSNTASRIGYGLRFRERVNSTTVNGKFTCAYRYEYVDYADEVGNAATYIKVKYIGANQNVSIGDINSEAWWNSITPDFERIFPATGHMRATAGNYPKGTFSTASGGTNQNERGYYWSCDKKDATNAYSMKPHETGTYGWAQDVPTYSFTVRLFKDAE